jgi:S-adenosylmethionine:tRNA ribosyltransferase-isomerase
VVTVEVPDYQLPEEAIAQSPVTPRDAARLLDATSASGSIDHRRVRDLPELLSAGDVLVVNNSRVMPARLALYKQTGGAAEVLVLAPTPTDPDEWTALVRPGRRLPPGTSLSRAPGEDPDVLVGERIGDGVRRVRFLRDPAEVMRTCGSVPLPPYIREPLADSERYQTVYADRPGSVAAPTAGLHLTEDLLARCTAKGVEVRVVDLAVGLATFRPLEVERAEEHRMHVESYRVPADTWQACSGARRVVAVGTTTVRALETANATGRLEGQSDLYIYGDYGFEVVDVLITNFHMPRSSLLLLLEAFCGQRWRCIYESALRAGYRFLSFGDAMIVTREHRASGSRRTSR